MRDNGQVTHTMLRLIFAEGPTFRDHYFSRDKRFRKRLRKYHKKTLWWMFCNYNVRLMSQARMSHVLLTDGQIVMDYQFTRVQFRTYNDVCADQNLNIIGHVTVPISQPLDFERWDGYDLGDPGWIRSIWLLVKLHAWRLSGGLIPNMNCVSISKKILRENGYEIRPWITCPNHLLGGLLDEGVHDFVAGNPAALDYTITQGAGSAQPSPESDGTSH